MRSSRFVKGMLLVYAFMYFSGMLWGAPMPADDPIKQIEKKLSSVQRRIVTEPSRAEKELVEACDLLAGLDVSSVDQAKMTTLRKRVEGLTKKLEKRLGRPIDDGKGTKEAEVAKEVRKISVKGTDHKKVAQKKNTQKKVVPKSSARKHAEKKQIAQKPIGASKLPSSVTSRIKKIDKALEAVEKALVANQLQTANRKMGDAKKLMAEIQKRCVGKVPDGNEEIAAVTKRIEGMATRLTDANDAEAQATANATAAREAQEAQSKEWAEKLSPYFDYNSPKFLRMASDFHRASEEEREMTLKAFAEAGELMAGYAKVEFPHGKTQELVYLENRLNEYLAEHNADRNRKQKEESCRKWVDTLRAYVDVGAGSRKYLVVGVTLSETEIRQRTALLEEARAIWPEYQGAEFPLGKTDRLLALEQEMQKRLEEMPETLRQSRALLSGDIDKEFTRVLDYLNADTGWKVSAVKKPNIAMKRDIEALEKALERFTGTVEPGDDKLADLQAKLAQIREQDKKNRTICAEHTFMLPDRWGGSDADDLREKALAIVGEKLARTKPLRVTLPAREWTMENVVEWTDTSRSAVRHRVTRYMTAQVAAKGNDGKVYLHGVHLASDQGPDGAWGPLKGHIMWSDWMVEKNVHEDPPAE